MSNRSTRLDNCATVINITHYYNIIYKQDEKFLIIIFDFWIGLVVSCDKRKFVIKTPLSRNRRSSCAFSGRAMPRRFGSAWRRWCRRGRRKLFATFKSRTHLAAPPRRIMCKIIASETDRFIVTVLRFGTQ